MPDPSVTYFYFLRHTSMLTPRNPGMIISGASVWSFVASLA